MMMDPTELAALSAFGVAVVTTIGAYLGTRSRVKIEDVVVVQKKLEDARGELDAEQKARTKDRTDMEAAARSERARDQAAARVERAQMEADHENRERILQARIDSLTEQLEVALKTVTKLDRLLFHARSYIARLLRVFADRAETPPPRPVELDEQ